MNSNEQFQLMWQDFCYDLIEAKKKRVLENVYQELIESGLRILGWSKAKNEICPQERINVGSNNQLEPDITMKIDGVPVFVIEIKHPNNKATSRQEEQLLSYMRIRQCVFGLYLGEDIRLYYDGGDDLPTIILSSSLEMNSKTGYEIVDFFNRQTFNPARIKLFCEDRYNNIKTGEIMAEFQTALKENQDDTIRKVLLEYFVDYKKCNKNLVKGILDSIRFSTSESGDDVNNKAIVGPTNGFVTTISGTKKCSRDMTKYSLDGGKTYFGKGKFVREVVRLFMENNPALTFRQLQQIFPDEMQGSYGVIRSIDSLNNSSQNKKDLLSRYEAKNTLTTKDNVEFAVCNQWGKYNFSNILNLLKRLGWSIVTD